MNYSKNTRTPKCAQCQNHGQLVRVRGHKRYCPWRLCRCYKCTVTYERRRVMASQVAVRRAQAQDEARAKEIAEQAFEVSKAGELLRNPTNQSYPYACGFDRTGAFHMPNSYALDHFRTSVPFPPLPMLFAKNYYATENGCVSDTPLESKHDAQSADISSSRSSSSDAEIDVGNLTEGKDITSTEDEQQTRPPSFPSRIKYSWAPLLPKAQIGSKISTLAVPTSRAVGDEVHFAGFPHNQNNSFIFPWISESLRTLFPINSSSSYEIMKTINGLLQTQQQLSPSSRDHLLYRMLKDHRGEVRQEALLQPQIRETTEEAASESRPTSSHKNGNECNDSSPTTRHGSPLPFSIPVLMSMETSKKRGSPEQMVKPNP